MNIITVLRVLCEAAEVNKIRASVGDKIPASVMDALAKNAKETQKGKFFDNETMAIIKSISGGNDDPYLLSNPNAVHSILKKLKKGDSSFKADKVLSGGKGKDYWKSLYKKSNEDKPELTKAEKDYNTVGLETAIVKSIDDEWFAILPKNFYDTEKAEKELRHPDVKKSHEDIRKISAEIAAKDSGKEKGSGSIWGNDGGRNEKTNPKVNHWCVSASGANYYDSYARDRVYKFIIFVKKNPDGSPNWDKRYLWYCNETGREEFADKWDKHTEVYRILSDKANKFTRSVRLNVVKSGAKRTKFIGTIQDAARDKAIKDLDTFKKNAKEYDITVDDELENMLKGTKRKNITRKKEAKVVAESMPWLEEANKLKAAELKKYFESKAKNILEDNYFKLSSYIYTDDFKNGVIVKRLPWGSEILIFSGDEPISLDLIKYYFKDYNNCSFDELAKRTNSVLYSSHAYSYKQILSFLRNIVKTSDVSKFESQRLSGYRPSSIDKNPLSTVHVKKVTANPEKTVMKNLSEIGQEIFNDSYSAIVSPDVLHRAEFKVNDWNLKKFFYNSELRTLFKISYIPEEKVYGVYYLHQEGNQVWKKLAIIDDNLDEVKKIIKDFQEKRKAELGVK